MHSDDQVTSRRFRVQMVAYAFFIGVIAGVLSIVFHYLVSMMNGYFSGLYQKQALLRFMIPMASVFLFMFTHNVLLKKDTRFGVTAVKHELDTIDRRLMIPNKVFVKILNAIVALGTGFAVGQFGPTVHIGGAIGSNLGHYLKLPREVVRLLIGCGVAGALSAVMHAPLFATLIVVEVIFARRYFDYIVPILLSSVVAVSLDKLIYGNYSFIAFPDVAKIETVGMAGWLMVIVIAIFMGFLAAFYVVGLKAVSALMQSKLSSNQQLLLAGVFTGIVALLVPQTLYTRLDLLVTSNGGMFTLGSLLLFLVLRFLLTSVQLGSGICGGNFTPGLLIGLIFSVIIHRVMLMMGLELFTLPHVMMFSIVGMLSGFSHAPLAAIVLALELTGRIELIVPILTVALIGHFVSDFLVKENVYMLK
ncbi:MULTISPECIES: chloride channel protein [unclassified Fusibacter]|uniref:chloride channel protein n=1 Tax=unclassified Fusibacter TaxID=2624464 RepID=UPI001012A484|nr:MULTISPECIES: chloride channel protein [unclassified Fusibacter]MCK8059473.1 chloride channel protein [Fusibacter sp. A2]NPE21063.1 chloride channel protein [Fusibacter sp. A1]RXV62337.1 hypothetical protein DWB64_04455 [Fusibacter sp. A1]